ncbi:MAG TPA: hypothetical protein PKX00_01040 [Opitutaceae bacterium]|nr:hypothetical protein [Opitutaceae bacterium]
MALKQLAHKPPAPLPAAPIWGIVAGEDETPLVLRLEWADRTESLPYHTLTRWTLEVGSEDVLTLHAARLVLTIGRWLPSGRRSIPADWFPSAPLRSAICPSNPAPS